MQRLFRKTKAKDLGNDPLSTPRTSGNNITPSVPKKQFSTGLKALYEPSNAVVDVVFVHGLTGDREKTWTAQGAVGPWPETLLPERLPEARILTFSYDAYVTDWRALVSKNRVGDHACSLLAALAAQREDDGSDNRPILFVCHSLGGLVCEDALVSSRNSAEEHLQKILECTRGIIFLGTPHHGSGLARWAESLARFIGVIKETNPHILGVLRSDSEVLARIQASFHNMIRGKISKGGPVIAITCFYEELPLPGIGEVVSKNSAILPGYTPIGIHDNHMGMTKFESKDDPGFKLVVAELLRFVKGIKLELSQTVVDNIGSTNPASASAPEAPQTVEENDVEQTEPPATDTESPAPTAKTPHETAERTIVKHIGNNVSSNTMYSGGTQNFHGAVRFG